MNLAFHTNKLPADKQKLRGGYYTPLNLAEYLAKWALRDGAEKILEPSCGDGNFIIAALKHFEKKSQTRKQASAQIVAVEIDGGELQKAKTRALKLGKNGVRVRWIHNDFFDAYSTLKNNDKFDVALGNPPFIRFQYFEDESREKAFFHLREADYKPTKLANAWAAFIQLSIELLREGGRLAMVVPAELLQVKYADELRKRLAGKFKHIVLVGFKKLVFPEIQQEVFLLLADGKRDSAGIESDIYTIEFEDGDKLLDTKRLSDAVSHIPSKHSRPGMKWTSLFMSNVAYGALDKAERTRGLIPLGQLAEVDVGVVTGRNKFFMLTKELRKKVAASRFTMPVIGKTSVLRSIVFDDNDFDEYKEQYPSYLLNLKNVPQSKIPKRLMGYIEHGEEEGVHRGYKCRIRPRWYDVPSIYAPDAFMFRQIHNYPLLVVNDTKATSTDTIHRVRIKDGVNIKKLAAICFNSLTLAWAEVCGRSYGGGVLELEPREAEELPVPYSDNIKIDVKKVEALLRLGRDYEALEYVDNIVLKKGIGFDEVEIINIRNAWIELRDRRTNRRKPLKSLQLPVVEGRHF